MNMIKSLDMFGRSYQLTFQGSSSYRTVFGALMSVLYLALFFSHAAYLLMQVYQSENFKYQHREQFYDSVYDGTLSAKDVDFAFAYSFIATNFDGAGKVKDITQQIDGSYF
jgi:hypothetical protein